MTASPVREREFEFSRQDYEEIRKAIHGHAGIALGDAKEDMVYSRVARRLRATGIRSFREYLNFLRSGHEEEWEAFVNSLTTNLTDFFREAHHFHLLKDFLKQRKDRPITIWCAACSTGEEAYSIAMTAVEAFGGFHAPVKVLASDLDTHVLQQGRAGIYPLERLQKLGASQQQQFFQRGTGEQAGTMRAKPELRALVEFFQLNLLDARYPMRAPLDAIFCRNVMIYFDKPTQHGILKRMKSLLKEDGLLFVGHSEALYHAADLFRLRGQTVYEKAQDTHARRL